MWKNLYEFTCGCGNKKIFEKDLVRNVYLTTPMTETLNRILGYDNPEPWGCNQGWTLITEFGRDTNKIIYGEDIE